jgi:hypothetical protein
MIDDEIDFEEITDEPRPIGSKCSVLCREPDPSHAHCTVCHTTFRTVTDFDKHRMTPRSRTDPLYKRSKMIKDGRCRDPERCGLVNVDELWATPAGHEERTRLSSQLAKGRVKPASPQGRRRP